MLDFKVLLEILLTIRDVGVDGGVYSTGLITAYIQNINWETCGAFRILS
jgi:hypothetical protein